VPAGVGDAVPTRGGALAHGHTAGAALADGSTGCPVSGASAEKHSSDTPATAATRLCSVASELEQLASAPDSGALVTVHTARSVTQLL